MNAKAQAGKPLTTQPTLSLAELMRDFADEDKCKAQLRDLRWPDGVRCPRCGNDKVFAVTSRPFHWVCKSGKEAVNEQSGLVSVCHKKNGYRFSVITKTVFENTNYPLKTWFQVIYLMTQGKKGMAALQIHRQIKSGDYRTAWFMCHRIRSAMMDKDFPKLMGQVEVDETYVGGKDRTRHWNRKSRQQRDAGTGVGYGKIGVIGAIARKGNVVCKVIGDTDATYSERLRAERGER